jgi:four helix bundle protein
MQKVKELKEYEFNNQLFRSSTSIGANIAEAESIEKVLSSIIITTKKRYNL